MCVAIRPRPVGNRRERLLVKLCGAEERRFGCVSKRRNAVLDFTLASHGQSEKKDEAVDHAVIRTPRENVDKDKPVVRRHEGATYSDTCLVGCRTRKRQR